MDEPIYARSGPARNFRTLSGLKTKIVEGR